MVEERLAVVETEVKMIRRELEDLRKLAMQTRDIVLEMKGKSSNGKNGSHHFVDIIKLLLAALLGALGIRISTGG